jgi:Glycosyl transferase family 90
MIPSTLLIAGRSYSGRLKYNMLCSSVIIGPEPFWIEFWTHLIKPGFNYISVNKDWSNLLSTHAEIEAHPKTTAQIAQNAVRTMEYLDPVGVSCYYRELIRQYADVCRWTVEEPEAGRHGVRRKAGSEWMAFEDYIIARLSDSMVA